MTHPRDNVESIGRFSEAEFLQVVEEDEAEALFRRAVSAILIAGTAFVACIAVGLAVVIL